MRERRVAIAAAAALVTGFGVVAATASASASTTGCKVAYTVSSQWPGGFGASVQVTNLGDAISGGWDLAFALPDGQTISQLWNGQVSQSGADVTVRNAAWNSSLAAGGTASFGFNASWNNSANRTPYLFTLNGTACASGSNTGSTGPMPSDPPPSSPSPSSVPPSSPPPSSPPPSSPAPSSPAPSSSSPPSGGTVRVMPLGDSITGNPGCWRALLWQQLQSAGHTEVDFVGTQPAQGCGFTHDGDNEGHGGYLATNIANQNMLPAWLSATDPDVVMIHLGTNDVWSNIAPSTILAAFTKLVSQARSQNPSMKFLVAQIIPVNPSSCSECAQRTVNFNAAIPSWAASLSTAQSPVTVVDQWTNFNTATDTYDGVHPNDNGNVKIAARWLPALTAVL